MSKNYPVGTMIKFISDYKDCKGKMGKIIGIINGAPLIYLPESSCVSCFSIKERPATVQCSWRDIEPTLFKNQQMLFDFMNDGRY